MTRRVAALVLACAVLGATGAAGQSGSSATVKGMVWDSLASRPLAGAEVLVDGSVAALSGADGAYSVRIPGGHHTVGFRHGDVSGWTALLREASVDLPAGQETTVDLGTPSARSLLVATCGGRGAVVGGQVLDLLTLVPLSTAGVDVRTDPQGDGDMATVRTGPDGSYQACVEGGVPVEIQARIGSTHGRPVTLRPGDGPVYVRDLFVQVAEPARVEGLVRDGSTGAPLPDASVQILGTRLGAATRPDGRFTFRGVPPGDMSLVVERIGYGHRVVALSAVGGSTVEMTLDVFPEAVSLDSMVVSVQGGTAERMRMGARYDGMTRPEIDEILPRAQSFDDLLRNANVPGLKIREMQKQSDNGMRYPGICIETGRTSTIVPGRCEMVEVYLNGVRLADPDQFLLALDPASIDRFQFLSRTQASVQYAGTPNARNGILLIYTRQGGR